jgi:hypothetical protein
MGNRILSVSVHPSAATTPAGLKRQVFDLPLSGVDLLTGPNGAGKTTRGPLAITAALEGLATVPTDPRRPYVGELPAATSVTLRVQTPGGIESLTRPLDQGKGIAVSAANQRARDLVGVPPTAWDLRDFATATPNGRASILDAVARAGGAMERWDAARAQGRVEALVQEAAPEDDDGAWLAPYRGLVAALDVAPDGVTWLRAAETWAADRQSITNARQRDAQGSLDTATREATDAPTGDRAADEARHRALLQRQAVAHDHHSATAARKRHMAEGERLRAALTAAEDEGKRLAQPTTAPDLQALTDRLARAEAAPRVDVGECEEQRRIAAAAHQQAQQAAAARTKAQAEVDALTRIDGGTCRHCHVADPLGSAVGLEPARQRLAALPASDESATATRLHAASEALNSARATERDQQREIADARASLEREQQRTTKADERRTQALAATRERWKKERATLTVWEAVETPQVTEPSAATDTAELADAESKMATWRRYDDARARTQRAADAYRVAKLAWDATRALLDAVRRTRDEVAAAAYGPIHAAARELLAGVDGLPQPFFHGPDEYGAKIGGQAVPYAGLSESEQRITAAAIVYALATVAGCPCRLVLLDGLEVVQRDHRAPLVGALARAQRAGRVDSVVLTMATAPGENTDDLAAVATVHRIERTEPPAAQPNRPAAVVDLAGGDSCPF